MEKWPFGPVPWDILVFVTLTGMGFAFSVQRYTQSRPVDGTAVVRSPASTSPLSHSLDLGCLETRSLSGRFEWEEKEVRLAGQFCRVTKAEAARFRGVHVRNATTGQRSTLYFVGYGNQFQTDTLVLVPGSNQVRVEWRESDDTPPREFTAEILSR